MHTVVDSCIASSVSILCSPSHIPSLPMCFQGSLWSISAIPHLAPLETHISWVPLMANRVKVHPLSLDFLSFIIFFSVLWTSIAIHSFIFPFIHSLNKLLLSVCCLTGLNITSSMKLFTTSLKRISHFLPVFPQHFVHIPDYICCTCHNETLLSSSPL